jgi:heme oxygenase (biliverdin-IX-beta and delta-forming)
VCYVLEGATLGAQIIRRRLTTHFGDQIAGALRYYGCYGEHAGERWRSFHALMTTQFNAESAAADDAVAAANATFATLDAWLRL